MDDLSAFVEATWESLFKVGIWLEVSPPNLIVLQNCLLPNWTFSLSGLSLTVSEVLLLHFSGIYTLTTERDGWLLWLSYRCCSFSLF